MLYFALFLCFGCTVVNAADKLAVLYQWKYVDFVWNDASHKSKAIDNGDYNATKCIPYDMDQGIDGSIFVTVAKDVGVPATLATISNKNGEGGPLLQPYPDWSWHKAGNCSGLTGVFRIAISQIYLYALDTGKIGQTQVCPAQLVIFDLRFNRAIQRIKIPPEYANNKNGTGLLLTPVVEAFGSDFNDVNVYMADTEGYGLVVWNGQKLRRLESKSFDPEPGATHFTVGDDSFDISDGILGMSITPEPYVDEHRLYYRPLASVNMYSVKTSDLLALRDGSSLTNYVKEPNEMRSQSAAQAFSANGILFFSSLTDRSLVCWNRQKTFNDENCVQFVVDEEKLQLPAGLKVVNHRAKGIQMPLERRGCREKDGDHLLVLTNRYQKVANGNMNFNEVNFRILGGKVADLVRGTNCER